MAPDTTALCHTAHMLIQQTLANALRTSNAMETDANLHN